MKAINCFTWELNQLVEIMETELNKVPVIDAEEFAFNYVKSIQNPDEYFSTVPNENIIIISHAQFLSEKYNTQKGVIEFAKHFPNPHGTGAVILQSDIPYEEIDFCDEIKEYIDRENERNIRIMSGKLFSNPNTDVYKIDFDLNNRWEKIDEDASNGKFDIKEFYDLCYDTYRFIEKYDKCEMIPRASLVLSDLLHMFFCDDWVLDSRRDFYLCTNHAGDLREMLIYGLEQDVETDKLQSNFNTEYNLISRWEQLDEDFYNTDSLDVARFRELAADTYKFIKKYHNSKMIHRSTPLLLQKIGLGHYNDAASFVAAEISRALVNALEYGLTEKTNENGEPVFVVYSDIGKFEVNANTFDFSEVVENAPDWVKYPENNKE